jgi:hypothetical protein
MTPALGFWGRSFLLARFISELPLPACRAVLFVIFIAAAEKYGKKSEI